MVDAAIDMAPGSSGGASLPTFSWGAVTHVGGVRDHNEDAFYVSHEVCVVADGMGGHEAGEVASQLVARLVAEAFSGDPVDVMALPPFVSAVNAAVLQRGTENNTPGMGTTMVGVAVASNGGAPSTVVFHVGDSRCYRLRNGILTQVTTDHSHVQELVAAGRISAEEAATHPLRNVITRALGADVAVHADFHILPEDDCRVLLCSDGLSGEIDDDRIWDLLTAHRDPTRAATALVEAVLEGPARDNVTAVVVDITFPDVDPTNDLVRSGAADVTADITPDVTADVTADIDNPDPASAVTNQLPITQPPAAMSPPASSPHAGHWLPPADARSPRRWSPPERWSAPEPTGRRDDAIDRPPSPADEAAWGKPRSAPTDPHQENVHAREEDH